MRDYCFPPNRNVKGSFRFQTTHFTKLYYGTSKSETSDQCTCIGTLYRARLNIGSTLKHKATQTHGHAKISIDLQHPYQHAPHLLQSCLIHYRRLTTQKIQDSLLHQPAAYVHTVLLVARSTISKLSRIRFQRPRLLLDIDRAFEVDFRRLVTDRQSAGAWRDPESIRQHGPNHDTGTRTRRTRFTLYGYCTRDGMPAVESGNSNSF